MHRKTNARYLHNKKEKAKYSINIRVLAFLLSFVILCCTGAIIIYPVPFAPSYAADPVPGQADIPTNGDDIGLVISSPQSIPEASLPATVLTDSQKAVITARVESTSFSLVNAEDFYYLALYSTYKNAPSGTVYQYTGTSSTPVTIPMQMTLAMEINGATETLDVTYPGIGSADYPFNQTINCTFPNTIIILGTGCASLFGTLSTDANLFSNGLILQCNASAGGLADTLILNGDKDYSSIAITGSINNTYTNSYVGLLFGSITGGTPSALTISGSCFTNATSVAASANGSAGAVAGRIASGTSLTLSSLTVPADITAVGGNAGGIAGIVEGSLTLSAGSAITLSGNITAGVGALGGNAGGIAGKVTGTLSTAGALSVTFGSSKTVFAAYLTSNQSGGGVGGIAGELSTGSITLGGALTLVNLNVKGGHYAGGVIGHAQTGTAVTRAAITASGAVTSAGAAGTAGGFIGTAGTFTLTATSVFSFTGTVSRGKYDGGYIGHWIAPNIPTGQASACLADENIKIGTDSTNKTEIFLSTNCLAAGGIIGMLEGAAGNADFTLNSVSNFITFAGTGNSGVSYGGLIGNITGGTYLAVTGNTSVYSDKLSSDSFGWMVGSIGDDDAIDRCILNISSAVTVNAPRAITGNIVNQTGRGTAVRFNTSFTCTVGGNAKIETVIGSQNDSLIFCESGWTLERNNTALADDIGNYGQIIRNGALSNFITLTQPAVGTHASVSIGTISGATTAAVTINSVEDFAKLAITMSSRGVFSAINGINNENTTVLMGIGITISASLSQIDLSNKGIESLTRTNSSNNPYTGTFNGNNKTVKLAIGRHYPDTVDSAADKTPSHSNLGLFAAINGATVSNLTIQGFIKGDSSKGKTIRAGGLAGSASGNVTITGVNSDINLVCSLEENNDDKSRVGGILGSYTGASLTMTGCRTDAEITLNPKNRDFTTEAGGLVGYIKATAAATVLDFSGCIISPTITSTPSFKEVRIGGVAATITKNENCYADVNLNELSFDSDPTGTHDYPSITVSASEKTGGFLGYSWSNVNVNFKGTVLGNMAVTGKAAVGGLVHTVEGKMELASGTALGYTLSRTSASTTGVSDGLVVCNGEKLYMKVSCAANFAENAVTTGFIHTGNTLDYLVGNNVTARDAETQIPKNGGIVSIETGGAFGVMPADGNAWYNLPKNTNTRYYYNLASKETTGFSLSDNTLTVANKDNLLLYHIKKYANNQCNLTTGCSYFNATGATTLVFSSDVNMSGMSFYPTSVDGLTVNLGTHTLTFGLPPTDADYTNVESQHYGAMTGLLLSVTGSLNVSNGTLSGTVSKWGAGKSGAIVTGIVTGNAGTTDTIINVSISSINASALKAEDAEGGLLINHIGTCATVQLTGITAEGTTVVAKALIGEAGGTVNGYAAKKLNITFADMLVNGVSGTDKKFSTAAFIASLSNCSSCVYNFNEGIPKITYCSELGDGVNKITQYYNTTNRVEKTVGANTISNFTTGFIPYVNGGYISVNVKGGNLTNGCGTNGDKYQISTYAQLLSVMKIINGSNPDVGFLVNYPVDPGSISSTAAHSATSHVEYIFSSGANLTATNASGATLSVINLREWLNKAYYQLTADIETDSAFTGLGTDISGKQKYFLGHIDGGDKTVTLTGFNASNFGFVSYAGGCELTNINFSYGTVTVANTPNISFGGAIGTVKAGDSFLDGVKVTYTSLAAQHVRSYVGGYVGLILNGAGVVFKNADTTLITIDGAGTGYYYSNSFVGRVLDGYALSEGITLNNGIDKNYYIPNISIAQPGVTVSKTDSVCTVSITSGQGLYLFSAAFNSSSLSRSGYLSGLIGFDGDANYTSDTWNITLTADCDVSSGYNNGFRGIGGLYSGPAIKLGTLDGKDKYVKMNRSMNQYESDSYLTTAMGLVNKLTVNQEAEIKDIIIRGKIELKQVDSTTYIGDIRVGGAVGCVTGNSLTLTNVHCGGDTAANSLAVYSQDAAGGMVGYSEKAVAFENCGFENIKVEGYRYNGGFLGVSTGAITVDNTATDIIIKNGLIKYLFAPAVATTDKDTGAGGLIGYTKATVTINGTGTEKIKLENIVVYSNTVTKQMNELGFGGLIGFIKAADCTVKNTDVAGLYIQGYYVDNVAVNTTYNTVYNTEYKLTDNVRDFTMTTDDGSLAADFTDQIYQHLSLNSTRSGNATSSVPSYINPGIGGIIGSVGENGTSNNAASVTLESVSVYSTGASRVVLVGGNSSGGFIGDYRYSRQLSITDSSFNANNLGPALVIGGTRAAGIVAYLHGTSGLLAQPLNAVNVNVGCSDYVTRVASTIQISSSFSSGIVAEAQKGAVVDGSLVQNCFIAGNASGGAIGVSIEVGVTLTDVTVKNSTILSKDGKGHSGGVILAVAKVNSGSLTQSAAAQTIYMNRVTSDTNKIVVCNENCKAGGFVGYSNLTSIYGNQLLWKDNILIKDTFPSSYNQVFEKTYNANDGNTTATGGVIAGATYGGNINILGFCRTETGADPVAYNEIGANNNSTDVKIVYSSYSSVTNAQIAEKVGTEYHLAPDTTAYGGLTLWGDAMLYDAGERRAETLEALNLWKENWNVGTYGALTDRLVTYKDFDTGAGKPELPLFNASVGTGNGVDAVTEYLDLLTNGGFSAWTDKSASSVYYTFAGGNYTNPQAGGSIGFDAENNQLVLGNRYDNITDGGTGNTFTLLTISMTNQSGSGSVTYTMTIPVYFPQVLNMTTKVIPMGYEEYSVSKFFVAPINTEASVITSGQFSLYIEYMFNEVRANDDWNMQKRLVSNGSNKLPAGTKLVLIDLNATDTAGRYGKAYTYTVTAQQEIILWSQFSDTYPYINLQDLKSIGYYTTPATSEAIFNTTANADFGIERYLIVGQFPAGYTIPADTALDVPFKADVINDRNIQIEGNSNAGDAVLKIWNPATLAMESEQENIGIAVQKDSGISVFADAEITYHTGYSVYEGDKSQWYGSFADIWLTNDDDSNARVEFPAGATISIAADPGSITDDLLVNRGTVYPDIYPGDTVNISYRVFVDLSAVSLEDYRSFVINSSGYHLHIKYYLTQDINNPRSGIAARELSIPLTTDKSVPLSVTANNSGDLGVNVYKNEKETVRIPFEVFADTNNYNRPQDTTLKLRFSLARKSSNYSVIQPNASNCVLTSLTNGVTVNIGTNYWEVSYPDGTEPTFPVLMRLDANTAGSEALSYNSYKLSAQLIEVSDADGTETEISNDDYFIFLVANMKTDIE